MGIGVLSSMRVCFGGRGGPSPAAASSIAPTAAPLSSCFAFESAVVVVFGAVGVWTFDSRRRAFFKALSARRAWRSACSRSSGEVSAVAFSSAGCSSARSGVALVGGVTGAAFVGASALVTADATAATVRRGALAERAAFTAAAIKAGPSAADIAPLA